MYVLGAEDFTNKTTIYWKAHYACWLSEDIHNSNFCGHWP